MGTPSLFPLFLKSGGTGAGGAAGTQYIETFGLEVLEMIEIELVDLDVDIEVVDLELDVELIEVIDVEIVC